MFESVRRVRYSLSHFSFHLPAISGSPSFLPLPGPLLLLFSPPPPVLFALGPSLSSICRLQKKLNWDFKAENYGSTCSRNNYLSSPASLLFALHFILVPPPFRHPCLWFSPHPQHTLLRRFYSLGPVSFSRRFAHHARHRFCCHRHLLVTLLDTRERGTGETTGRFRSLRDDCGASDFYRSTTTSLLRYSGDAYCGLVIVVVQRRRWWR